MEAVKHRLAVCCKNYVAQQAVACHHHWLDEEE
jgi:hypothetical protein